jgi:hypothetical protein
VVQDVDKITQGGVLMDSPKILEKKKRYKEKLLKKMYPNAVAVIDPEADEGNMNWFYTAQLLASGDPEKIAEANRLLNTPTQMVFFDKDGKEIEFTEDGPDPEP